MQASDLIELHHFIALVLGAIYTAFVHENGFACTRRYHALWFILFPQILVWIAIMLIGIRFKLAAPLFKESRRHE